MARCFVRKKKRTVNQKIGLGKFMYENTFSKHDFKP